MDNWYKFFNGWTVFKTVKIQERFIKMILKYTNRESKLIELAAGSGLTSFILIYSGRPKTTISDIDEELLKTFVDKFGFELNVQKDDMFDTGIADKFYDVCFHQGALEHFEDEDIIRALKEGARISKYLIFDIPNSRRFDKTQEYGNERFMPVWKWKHLIKEAGLELVEYDGRRLNPIFKYLPFDLENNDFINKWFGTSSIFVCKEKNNG